VATVTSALSGVRLFAAPAEAVKREADALRRTRPRDAALLDRLASQPTAHWIGGWARDLRGEVSRVASFASSTGAVPVLVAYNIPNRDCGGHSAGGDRDAGGYARWIRDFAAGLRGHKTIVVLEPDALGHLDCLDRNGQESRLAMLRDAVGVLKDNGATVYVDAGNARWVKPELMADRLRRAGLDRADGFALNVSNFVPTPESVRYGERVASMSGNKHFIIDTSRNGLGGNGQWCNPRGQALGAFPTTQTGNPLVDAYLWVKAPGQSDGPCNGGPSAGRFWTEYALELARNQPEQFSSLVRLASR
jgi:endoglucanase